MAMWALWSIIYIPLGMRDTFSACTLSGEPEGLITLISH